MKKYKKSRSTPLLRIRPMITGIVMVVLMISGPLILVWKQVYFNTTSLHMDSMRKKLTTLKKEAAMLRMSCNRLSSTDRIELIAHKKLGMDYPTTSQINVVHVSSKNKIGVFGKTQNIVTLFKKMITGEQG